MHHDCTMKSCNPSRGSSMWWTSTDAGLMQIHTHPPWSVRSPHTHALASTIEDKRKACSVCAHLCSPSEVCVSCSRAQVSHARFSCSEENRFSPTGVLDATQPMLRYNEATHTTSTGLRRIMLRSARVSPSFLLSISLSL